MQEEIEHKTVNFAISTVKLSARTLLKGAQFFLRQYDKSASQGKQSMNRLIRQNRGVTNLEIEKTGIKDFDRCAKRYHIDYTNSRNVTYSTVGDYLLPNLTLNQPRKPLGKYGRLRRTYLMNHRPVLYNSMLLNGSLYPHLMEVEQTAESRMQQTMAQLLKQTPAPDKEQNQMAWVQHMNSLKAQAEELVLNELIYS